MSSRLSSKIKLYRKPHFQKVCKLTVCHRRTCKKRSGTLEILMNTNWEKDKRGECRETGGDMCEVRWVKILQENLSQSVRIPKWRRELLPSLLLEKRFAQYFHGNAEPSASWPHAHTRAYRVLRFTSSTIAALFAGLNTQATAKRAGYSFPATHQSRIRCTHLPMNCICFLSIGCIQKEKAKNKTRRAILAGWVCFDSSAAQYLAGVFEFW